MTDYKARRRLFLRLASGVMLPSSFLKLEYVCAQSESTPLQPPKAPGFGPAPLDPSKEVIKPEVYEKWLKEVGEAARLLAEQNGTVYTPDVYQNFDHSARETLENNGYQIPKPPTNLQIY